MADVRVGVRRWAGDVEAEPAERGVAEVGFAWVQIDDVVLDSSKAGVISVKHESAEGGVSRVTIELVCSSYATVDRRLRPNRWQLRRWRRQ